MYHFLRLQNMVKRLYNNDVILLTLIFLKMNNLIQKISAWLLVSSENPENVSLTLKGLMIGAIPTALLLGGFAHLQLSNEQLTALVDNASNLVTVLLTAVSLGVSGYGLVRKILNNLYDLVHPAPLA